MATPSANNSTITGGTLTTSTSDQLDTGSGVSTNGITDLIIYQNNPTGTLTIGSTVADFGFSNSEGTNLTTGDNYFASTGITKSGPGALVLTGTNTYSGNTYVNDGTLVVGTSPTITQWRDHQWRG